MLYYNIIIIKSDCPVETLSSLLPSYHISIAGRGFCMVETTPLSLKPPVVVYVSLEYFVITHAKAVALESHRCNSIKGHSPKQTRDDSRHFQLNHQ